MTNIPDPRVLSDEATYIAVTARRLQLLADGLLGDHGNAGGAGSVRPGDTWLDWEVSHVGGGDTHEMDAMLLTQTQPADVLMATCVACAMRTRLTDFPLGKVVPEPGQLGSLAWLHGLDVWDGLQRLAFLYALPARLRGTVAAQLGWYDEPPPDLPHALAMVAEFAYVPPPYDARVSEQPTPTPDWDHQWPDDDEDEDTIPWDEVAKTCLAMFNEGGPTDVFNYLTRLDEEDA